MLEDLDLKSTVVMAPGGESATVTARYVCDQPTHLWVSVKQKADGLRDPLLTAEGSSQFAGAWLQRHPQTLNCDGRSHVQAFTVDKSEYGFGALCGGQAWVQFCMTTGSEDDASLVAYPSRWVTVR